MPSISAIVGIPPKSATKLRKQGVRSSEGLLRRAAAKKDRAELAESTGIDPDHLLGWVLAADLMRVRGVGGEYAALLMAAGATTTRDLRRRSAQALTTRLAEVNDGRRLVRRLPTTSMVASWIEHAAEVDPVVRR
jgi:predicted flap endonuclease-1-like 5' DNA nuclease